MNLLLPVASFAAPNIMKRKKKKKTTKSLTIKINVFLVVTRESRFHVVRSVQTRTSVPEPRISGACRVPTAVAYDSTAFTGLSPWTPFVPETRECFLR